jgi:hypothetical protein
MEIHIISLKIVTFGGHIWEHLGDNLAYPLTCHYITRDTCCIYATADVENNNNNNKNLNLKKTKI